MHSIRHDPDLGLLFVEIVGKYGFSDAQQLPGEVVAAIRDHGCHRVLVDLHDAHLSLTTLQLYEGPNLVRAAFEAAGLTAQTIRWAVVVPLDVPDATFLRNVAANRGQPVHLFRDVAEAQAWLLESPDQSCAS